MFKAQRGRTLPHPLATQTPGPPSCSVTTAVLALFRTPSQEVGNRLFLLKGSVAFPLEPNIKWLPKTGPQMTKLHLLDSCSDFRYPHALPSPTTVCADLNSKGNSSDLSGIVGGVCK